MLCKAPFVTEHIKGYCLLSCLEQVTSEHILEFMAEQGVTDVRRINVRHDGEMKPTNTYVFTFNSPVLPTAVKVGFI